MWTVSVYPVRGRQQRRREHPRRLRVSAAARSAVNVMTAAEYTKAWDQSKNGRETRIAVVVEVHKVSIN